MTGGQNITQTVTYVPIEVTKAVLQQMAVAGAEVTMW